MAIPTPYARGVLAEPEPQGVLAGIGQGGLLSGLRDLRNREPGRRPVLDMLGRNASSLFQAGTGVLMAPTRRLASQAWSQGMGNGAQVDAYRNKEKAEERARLKREQSLATVLASLAEQGKLPTGIDPAALAANPELGIAIAGNAFKPPETPDPFTLGPGQTRFGADGQPIAAVPPTPSTQETWRPLSPQDRASYNIPANDTRPWQISSNGDLRLPGQPQTQVSIDQRGSTAWETESAKLFAKRYDDIQTQAASATDMIGMYDLAEDALASGIYTGIGGEQVQSLRRMGAALGIDNAESVAAGELVTSLQNRMALIMRSPDAGMGMPGAVSDKDIVFLKQAQIGLDRSPDGNKRMIEAFRRLEQRKIEIARIADQYISQNGRLDAGFFEAVRQYAEANPLFGDAAQSDGWQDMGDGVRIREIQ